jgi:uncharacterized protein with FMN-binding domain
MQNSDTAPVNTPSRSKSRAARLSGGLVALSSAAILAVYGAGYVRTEVPLAPPEQSPTPITLIARGAPTALPAQTAFPTQMIVPPTSEAPQFPPSPFSTPTAVPVVAAPAGPLRDGTYLGTGSSRHGSIQVTLIIQDGQITSAEITQCGTRYPCSKVATLPGEVLARQTASVDVVSGATDSTTAYRGAVASALAQAH